MTRVVVTGVGAVSPLGVGASTLLDGWMAGRSGIEEGLGRCSDFEPGDLLSKKQQHRTDRFTQLAIAASTESLGQAGLDGGDGVDPLRVACVLGTGIGGLSIVEAEHDMLRDYGPERVSALAVPRMMPNAAAGMVAMWHGLRGPAFGVVSACAAGADAIGAAARLIRCGEADVALTGGAESTLTPLGIAGFRAMGALSRSGVSRPFDAGRDGFVLGEGAGTLVLESESHARERGATVLGEIAGYGAAADAYHITAPDPTGAGAARAIAAALAQAGVEPGEVDYVNAHGTATKLNDRSETLALKQALGARAGTVPVSSAKSAIGHLLGGAGAVEAVATVLSLRARTAPPTLNYETPEEDLDLDYVPGRARPLARNGRPLTAISNSFGFGGHNAVLCFREAA